VVPYRTGLERLSTVEQKPCRPAHQCSCHTTFPLAVNGPSLRSNRDASLASITWLCSHGNMDVPSHYTARRRKDHAVEVGTESTKIVLRVAGSSRHVLLAKYILMLKLDFACCGVRERTNPTPTLTTGNPWCAYTRSTATPLSLPSTVLTKSSPRCFR